jgi:hypothetical protein
VSSATGVEKIEVSFLASSVSVESLSSDGRADGGIELAAMVSSLNQPTALALRFSKGQCSSVSLIKASRTRSEGCAWRIEVVRMWAWYRRVGDWVWADRRDSTLQSLVS